MMLPLAQIYTHASYTSIDQIRNKTTGHWVYLLPPVSESIAYLQLRTPSKAPVVSLSKTLYPYWLIPGTDSSVISQSN